MTIIDSGDPEFRNKLLIGTPTMGLVRMEWVRARYTAAMPVNWAVSEVIPLRFLVDEAQNIIVREFLDGDYTWLLLLEDDVILPPNGFRKIHEHMVSRRFPVVSGLYYTKRLLPEPHIYRGRGTGPYTDFEIGDHVWCDGVPTGCLLIHRSLLEAMAADAPEVTFREQTARQVFQTIRTIEHDSDTEARGANYSSDLAWCDAVIAGGYLKEWDLPHPEWPFLVDTSLFCLHIGKDGTTYPRVRAPE